jgi:DNA polymerase-3 subunit epsilon/ATP-dependent DNA helicase DinG
MHGELVALDLETTGLDPANDAILELAAVRMRDGQILAEFQTLIDPQRSIPQFITQLTGITDDSVIGQPRIAQALPDFVAFVGDAPIIAHNIEMDTSFLYRLGALRSNPRIDTLELATALIPQATRYALGSLADEFGLALDHAHRALDDARATALLYWRLWQRLLALPQTLVAEIVGHAGHMPWDAKGVFEAALRERVGVGAPAHGDDPPMSGHPAPGSQQPPAPQAQAPASVGKALELPLRAFFASDGPVAARLPGYEPRQGQVEMAEAVDAALRRGNHLMVEAATGIGKTLAYLAPAMRCAFERAERVVVSTSTLALQSQLIDKDVPLLRAALGLDVDAVVLKGRVNYLCPRRFAALRARGPSSPDELRLLVRLLVWQLTNTSGERQDISLRGATEYELWRRLSAEDEGCTAEICEAIGGQCPFHRARRAAESAQIIVVNHALLVADALAAQRTLPDYSAVVIDEAQHLEDATTDGLGFSIDAPLLKYHLSDATSKTRGLLPDIVRAVRTGAPEAEAVRFESYSEIVRDAAKATSVHVGALFEALGLLFAEANGDRPDQQPVRVTGEMRQNANFERATAVWRDLNEYFDGMSSAMRRLASGLNKLAQYPIPDQLHLAHAATSAARYFQTAHAQLNDFISGQSPNLVYWLERGHEGRGVALNGAPLHVGAAIDRHLWSAKRSVILTGATLQSAGGFEFLKDRLAAETVETLTIPSPFDFKRAVLMYLPTDLPEPNDRARYQGAVERAILELATALEGRMLVLFTSYAQLKQTSQAVAPRLALGNIQVFDQGDSGKQATLEAFRANPRAVLMGTRSYWEGIDLPGDALRGLVIARLPFSVPNEPVFAARAEQYKSAFDEYSVPDAVLKFRQGFGRLIRSSTDRGVCVVLDGRIVSKAYGKAFLEALPDVTLQKAPLAGLAEAARVWAAGAQM